MVLLTFFVGFLAFLPNLCIALLDDPILIFSEEEAALRITSAPIICSQDDAAGIHIAANSLAKDLEQITTIGRDVLFLESFDAALTNTSTLPSAIIAGSLDSSLIQHLVDTAKIEVSELVGKWESFETTVIENPLPFVDRALVIVGSDSRGASFGIYTLSEQAGQSPYHFFADVPAKKHDQIYALMRTVMHKGPAVKYRGIFINDEEPALNGWWARYNNKTRQPLNAEFYSHVFDMLLRLKGNFMWPAMWKSFTPPPGNIFFTDDPRNQQLAHDYGVVISTSHHEPMQRASNEWNVTEKGPWDWSKNRENITQFMDEGVARAGSNESYFTLGMRGLGDEAMAVDDATEVLAEVFEVQRDIIEKYHGSASAVPQLWALYKEVASYYEAGLDPPEDVTLLFPDDNFGNMHRLPTKNESLRAGGCGIYYHFEYVGQPRSYKWANTNNLPKVFKELSQAYMRGANQIWIMNVGDIKPMELPLAMSMDMAWNGDKMRIEDIPSYLELYASRTFGQEHAAEIADILMEHSNLIGYRRHESVTSGTFSTVNYHEAERVLDRWNALANRSSSLYEQMPEDYKPAFYQLLHHPVASGALLHSIQIGVGQNYRFAQERRNYANTLAGRIVDDFEKAYDLTEEWDAMLDGKWSNMMSQAVYDAVPQQPKLWASPSRDMVANISYVQLRQNMPFAQGNLGIYAEGSDSSVQQARWAESVDSSMPTVEYPALLPVMDPYGPNVRHVDLFARGDYRVPIQWALEEVPEVWLSVQPMAGVLDKDTTMQRLDFIVDWDAVPDGFNDTVEIGITATPSEYPYFDLIRVPVSKMQPPSNFTGFPESAGLISIEAPHYQRRASTDNGTTRFEPIPFLGTRSESGALAIRPFTAARESRSPDSAWVEYNVHLFEDSDAVTATVYITSNLDTDPDVSMQFSLTLDSAPMNMTRLLGDPVSKDHVGDTPPIWEIQVLDQVWTQTIDMGAVEAGSHTLRWAVNSPEIYLEKIVLDTHGGVRESYLGPPETGMI